MENVLDCMVSLYARANCTTKLKDVNLDTFLNTHVAKLDLQVNAIRQEIDEKKRSDMKKKLPGVTVSGTFNARTNAGLVKHSGLICLDLDGKANKHVTNFNNLIPELKLIRQVAYCNYSVSLTGYLVIIPIAHPEKHLQHWLALEKDFARLGLNIDPSCKNVSRLRFYGHHENAYFNKSADLYTKMLDNTAGRVLERQTSFSANNPVEECIIRIEQCGIDITTSYHDWLKVGFALANEFGEEGREYFHRISRFYSAYDPNETNKKYDACLNSNTRVTIASLFYLCNYHNISGGDKTWTR